MKYIKEKSYLSVITYINNDTVHTQKFVVNLHAYLLKTFDNFEIILVNNGNQDSAIKKYYELSNQVQGHISIINLPWKHNIEAAMLAGADLSVGDFIIEIDSPENIYDLGIIRKIFDKCTSGFDIVSAIPNEQRLSLSHWFYYLIKKFSKLSLNLNSEPIRILTRRALNAALRSKEKVRYRQVSYFLTGYPYNFVGFDLIGKYQSNKTFSEKVSFALEIVLSYTDLGINLTLGLSFFFLLLSLLVGLYAISIYLTSKQVALGWTTTMLFLSFGFSGFFLITGVLTKYLMMVLLETKNRSQYVVQSIKKVK